MGCFQFNFPPGFLVLVESAEVDGVKCIFKYYYHKNMRVLLDSLLSHYSFNNLFM